MTEQIGAGWFGDYNAAMTAIDEAKDLPALARGGRAGASRQGEVGTSTGETITPGSDDNGWIIPPPVTLGDGSHVQLYKDGQALRAAYQAIRGARRRVCLELYIFHADETGRSFADLLCEKAREGVSVHVIYDSFPNGVAERRMYRRMEQAGVKVREVHPMLPWNCRFSWRPALRDHRKLLLIDDHIAGLGGLNIGVEYGGSWAKGSYILGSDIFRDNAIGIVGPSARRFHPSFFNMWRYLGQGGPIRRAQYIYGLHGEPDCDPAAAPPELGVLASAPTRSSPLGPLLHELLSGAKRSIQLTIAYFCPPDRLVEALCRAARRGVRVQLMLPARTDLVLFVIAGRAFYETLLSAGVEIYERQEAVLHAKNIVIDRETTVIGSVNLDHRAIEYNFELSAIVRSKAFGEQMDRLFQHDIEYAERITLNQWRHRPVHDRIVQWAVMRARYLL